MIAKVIVDVATSQTNRVYDYKVPVQWTSVIQKGMRVIVPFGRRKVQGFVIDLQEHSDFPKLKAIEQLLDLEPVLTEELIDLGFWLSKETLCFSVTAFQAMLPVALKVDYKKHVKVLHPNKLPDEIVPLFRNRNAILLSDLKDISSEQMVLIQKLLKQDILELKTEIKDRKTKKMIKVIKPAIARKSINEQIKLLHSRATKQKQILEWFYEHFTEIPVQQLMEKLNVSRSVITSLIEKQLLTEEERQVYRDPYKISSNEMSEPLPLTAVQKQAIAPILTAVSQEKRETFLVHGVTGSGKTEIYLQSIAKVIEKGKEAIVLVPEISLTPQMVKRFKQRFGEKVAVMHSGLSAGEKFDEWLKIQRKQVKVVVGARSAIFAPFENLGMIIIDEEHESSYKQEETPRYHAREVAEWRSKYHQCPLVLGSATPSLESYARSVKGVYHLCELSERIHSQQMPTVMIVDMREEMRAGNRSIFSTTLIEHLKETIARGEQCVLLLNRRGFSTFIICRDCGYVAECPHCDISLTYHKIKQTIKCHYCGYEEPSATQCPECQSQHIRFFGTGTQKVEEELSKLIPEVRIIRMDVDTTSRKGAHEKLLTAFGNKQADVLLGTQMIAKGLDFPDVTLVGVITADTMLNLPDFRSAERTFQLLTQVAGRAGRHERLGNVIIQTYTPEHYSIQYASEHHYQAFFNREMSIRKTHGYPPYYFLTVITISHPELMEVIAVSEQIAIFLKRKLSNHAIVLGPAACVIPRIKDRYRYQCMIKYKHEPRLRKVIQAILTYFADAMERDDLLITVDMQPYHLM